LEGSDITPRGLGHVDSRQDILNIRFELRPKSVSTGADDYGKAKHGRSKSSKAAREGKKHEEKVIEIELAQDKTALRSRKGDTGSVLWKAR
jgi:protein N-lysine methyltransferase METTL21D